MQLQLSVFIKRLLIATAVYIGLVLIGGIPAVSQRVANVYTNGAGKALRLALPAGYIHCEANNDHNQTYVRVLFGNKAETDKAIESARVTHSRDADLKLKEIKIRFAEFFYYAALFFIALMSISPFAWKQRLLYTGVGLAVFVILTYLKLICYTLQAYTTAQLGVYELTGASLAFVSAVYTHMKTGVGFILAAALWVLISFARSDWRERLQKW